MQKPFVGVLGVPLMIAVTLLALSGAWRLSQPAYPVGQIPSVSATGEGKIKATPDIAEVRFSVVNQGVSPVTIQALNDRQMTAVFDYLKSKGVKEEDLKSVNYNLSPQYHYDDPRIGGTPRPPQIIGYTLTHTASAKIRDLDSVGEILGALPEHGVNQVESINFYVDNPEPLRTVAREQAIAKARGEAEKTARALGVRLGKIISFSEGPIYYPAPYALRGAEFGMGGDAAGLKTPIEPGEGEVAVSVYITYSIR